MIVSIYCFSACSDKAPVVDNTPKILSIAACIHDSLRVDTLYYDLWGSEIKLPTVFTPNGDGIDDFFYSRFEGDSIVITQYSIETQWVRPHWTVNDSHDSQPTIQGGPTPC